MKRGERYRLLKYLFKEIFIKEQDLSSYRLVIYHFFPETFIRAIVFLINEFFISQVFRREILSNLIQAESRWCKRLFRYRPQKCFKVFQFPPLSILIQYVNFNKSRNLNISFSKSRYVDYRTQLFVN